ncbi:MAG: lysophospholipid acyltransferase family protein [Candidatus Avigastranaerophilus sp.]
MTTKFSTKTAKSFNIWRKIFQYIVCNIAIKNWVSPKYKFIVEGRENIDKKQKYIIASNHVTGLDPFMIAANLNMTVAFMAKKQLFETFWSSILMDWCGAFAVDREKVDVSTIKTALSVQKTNWNLGLFPQGTRCNNGKMENIMKGFASIAKKMQRDVLPVAIIVKTNEDSKRKEFIVKAGTPISFNDKDLINKWANTVCELAGLEYIPS